MLGLLVTVLALVAGVGRAAKANTVRVTVLNEVRATKARPLAECYGSPKYLRSNKNFPS